ncbi:MAG: c-type cytochrome biogenesis protein CcmI/CycH, partial [Steroidobacteraceae bacterium]
SPGLRFARTAGAPLFVFVRDPKQPGPPLAVKRLDTHFPQNVELTTADAMIPGRAISPGEDVQIVARIARSGSPIAQKGDPFGETAYRVGRDGIVDVTIDRLTP